MDYRVEPRQGSDRFVIVGKDGKVVNDAGGYGYTSKQKAIKAMWYHFGGGKQKIDSTKNEARNFWSSHKEAAKYLNELYEMNIKELARDEVTEKDLLEEVCQKYSIESIPEKYLEYLP